MAKSVYFNRDSQLNDCVCVDIAHSIIRNGGREWDYLEDIQRVLEEGREEVRCECRDGLLGSRFIYRTCSSSNISAAVI